MALWVDMAFLQYLLHRAIVVLIQTHRLRLALCAPQALIRQALELPTARSVLLAPTLPLLALQTLHHASNALAATIVLLAPLHGLV